MVLPQNLGFGYHAVLPMMMARLPESGLGCHRSYFSGYAVRIR
jgi:hypothetical protein